MHLAEPGCAVTAVELERYEHYVKFLAEIKVRWVSRVGGQGCLNLAVVRLCVPLCPMHERFLCVRRTEGSIAPSA